MSRRRRPPSLTPEDVALWRRVTESVRPLETRRPDRETRGQAPAAEEAAAPPPPAASSRPTFPPLRSRASPPPPAAAVDKRLVRRAGRGRASVEAVLDLHGLTQRQAHARLAAFLRESQAAGRRLVLVVTGKGRIDGTGDWWEDTPRGVLRRAVPAWLETPELRPLVVGWRQAHVRKGGEGAIYVQIRRRRAGEPSP